MMYMKIIPKLCLTKKGACCFKSSFSVCISIVEKFFVLFIDKVIAAPPAIASKFNSKIRSCKNFPIINELVTDKGGSYCDRIWP